MDSCVLDSFHHILDPSRELFSLFFFVALNNNWLSKCYEEAVYLQLSRKSQCRNVLNKDAAALFLDYLEPDDLRAQRSDSRCRWSIIVELF